MLLTSFLNDQNASFLKAVALHVVGDAQGLGTSLASAGDAADDGGN